MEYDLSVIVLSYNPILEKLVNTLYSIIIQRNISFEIIIADDGSKKNYFTELKQWFQKNNFVHYKFVENKKNQGTVKNFLSALNVAQGKYVKDISPGDYLYHNNILFQFKTYMDEKELRLCFGKAAFYSYENGNYILYEKQNPMDLGIYRKYNKKKIYRNYFFYQDYALGANFIFETKTIKKYINQIKEYVTYAEDTAVLCMLASQIELGFMDEYLVWYEYGTGISTSSNSKWGKIIFAENEQIFRMLSKNNKYIKKAYHYNFNSLHNRYLDIFRKIILSPPYLLFGIKSKWKKEPLRCNISQLKDITSHGSEVFVETFK